jgi:hypothetical protein
MFIIYQAKKVIKNWAQKENYEIKSKKISVVKFGKLASFGTYN